MKKLNEINRQIPVCLKRDLCDGRMSREDFDRYEECLYKRIYDVQSFTKEDKSFMDKIDVKHRVEYYSDKPGAAAMSMFS